MDLGIAGRTAIVCGSSRGLGRASAEALAAEGVDVVLNGRRADLVEMAVAAINLRDGGRAVGVVGDVTTAATRAALLEAAPSADILVTNAGGPTPRAFSATTEADWAEATATGMIAPLTLTRAVLPGMIERRFGRIVNITSAMVTTPRPHMSLSSGPRAGLTAAMKAISLDVARHNVTVNNLLPERLDTDRQHFMAQSASEREGITYAEARRRQTDSIAARRLGDPAEFGALCAFMCSALAGFMSGQNLHVDGGSYPGLV